MSQYKQPDRHQRKSGEAFRNDAVIEMPYTLWKDRQKKVIDPLLFSEFAENLAKTIGSKGTKKLNKGTQLRRYYDEIVRLNIMARTAQKETDWDTIRPHVHMLLAKAVYAKGRDLVTDEFVNFMRSGIKQIEQKEDLQVFANLFEAFTAFYKVYGPKE